MVFPMPELWSFTPEHCYLHLHIHSLPHGLSLISCGRVAGEGIRRGRASNNNKKFGS